MKSRDNDDLSGLALQAVSAIMKKRLLKKSVIAGLEIHLRIPPVGEFKHCIEQRFYTKFGFDNNSEVTCLVIYDNK